MRSYLHCSRRLVLALALVVSSLVPAHARLISVDLQSSDSGAAPQNFTGVEAEAAGINPLFSAANVWNHLQIPFTPATTNPTFTNLVDSTGSSTTVSFAISGAVESFNIFGLISADALRGDAFIFNNPFGTSSSIDWTLTGLTPNTPHLLFFYGGFWNHTSSFNMVVDTDGDGNLSDETAQAVVTLNGAPPPGTLFSAVSDASGVIRGQGVGNAINAEVSWAGFQVAEGMLSLPDLTVSTTDSPDPVVVTDHLTYTVIIENIDVGEASDVTLTDTLPPSVNFVSVTPADSCEEADGVVTCTLGTLASEESVIVLIVVQPTEEGTITNQVEVTSAETDANPNDNSDVEQTTVNPLLCNGLVPTIVGTPGSDTITGTNGPDVIHGLGGNDTISGGHNTDVICGGEGNDILSGDNGIDRLFGENGNDTLNGNSGEDALDGGAGTDTCNGGTGADTGANCETVTSIP